MVRDQCEWNGIERNYYIKKRRTRTLVGRERKLRDREHLDVFGKHLLQVDGHVSNDAVAGLVHVRETNHCAARSLELPGREGSKQGD